MFKKAWKGLVCGVLAALMLATGFGLANADGNTVSSASDLRRGQIVRFGEWYGDPLGWYVLDIQGSRVMLMLAGAWLENMRYNDVRKPVTWETCTLRQWLNGEFYDNAFTGNEKKRILEVTVPADRNPDYPNVDPGNATKDRVFLLSIPEYQKLLKVEKMRVFAKPDGKAQWWWLRSPGNKPDIAASVGSVGSLLNGGIRVDYVDVAVRPVLWIYM